jgi:hypothetical protein
MVAVVVWGFLLHRRRQQVSGSYTWIKFPDELARAMVVIDRIRDGKNAG